MDIEAFENQVRRAIDGKSNDPLAVAIRSRKSVYVGAKSDPYQNAELIHGVSRRALEFLLKNGFHLVVTTMFTENMERDRELFEKYRPQITILPIVSPGLDRDWEILEKRGTTRLTKRLEHAAEWMKRGFRVGINGEPFIPGFHTLNDFRETVRRIKDLGLSSYNTYYLHFNDWNAKKMHEAGVDIERVWELNQDKPWKPILAELIRIAEEEGVTLGCPDFVNSGTYTEPTNTCCGVDVPNPTTFNFHHWKRLALQGRSVDEIIELTWDGVGDKEEGRRILRGEVPKMFSLYDNPECSKIIFKKERV